MLFGVGSGGELDIVCQQRVCGVCLQQQLGTLHLYFSCCVANRSVDVELLFLLAFSSGTVQECGDNPSLSRAHSSCCHRCPRTGVCSLSACCAYSAAMVCHSLVSWVIQNHNSLFFIERERNRSVNFNTNIPPPALLATTLICFLPRAPTLINPSPNQGEDGFVLREAAPAW